MADYKEKLNEVKDSVKDAAATIVSEENKQKREKATDTVAEKAKGLKGKSKTIILAAVAVVAVIVLISKIGGSSKAEKVLKAELENKYHYSVSNIKEEFKDSFKVQSATLDGNFEKADFYIMSCETEVGNNPNSQRYAVYTVMLYEDGSSVVQIQAECSSKKEFKGWLNKIIRDSKASIKLQKKEKTLK